MRLNLKSVLASVAVVASLMYLGGCTKDEGVRPSAEVPIDERGPILGGSAGGASASLIGLSRDNQLIHLVAGPPAQATSVVPITGLRVGEQIIGIETRPSTKELFGVSNQNLLYKIDKFSGTARPVSVDSIEFNPNLTGDLLGLDFNPMDDVLRIVTSDGQNLRVSPTTGEVIGVDISFGATGPVSFNSIAYSFPTSLGGKSDLYGIDLLSGNLYKVVNPNAAEIQLVGNTGFSWTGDGGFEILPGNQVFTVQYGTSTVLKNPSGDDTGFPAFRLYGVSLASGKTFSYGQVRPLIGLAAR